MSASFTHAEFDNDGQIYQFFAASTKHELNKTFGHKNSGLALEFVEGEPKFPTQKQVVSSPKWKGVEVHSENANVQPVILKYPFKAEDLQSAIQTVSQEIK